MCISAPVTQTATTPPTPPPPPPPQASRAGALRRRQPGQTQAFRSPTILTSPTAEETQATINRKTLLGQ